MSSVHVVTSIVLVTSAQMCLFASLSSRRHDYCGRGCVVPLSNLAHNMFVETVGTDTAECKGLEQPQHWRSHSLQHLPTFAKTPNRSILPTFAKTPNPSILPTFAKTPNPSLLPTCRRLTVKQKWVERHLAGAMGGGTRGILTVKHIVPPKLIP